MTGIVEVREREMPTTRDRAHRVRDVAAMFDTSERTIWRWIEGGQLKAERLSARCIRVFDSEIARYRESLKTKMLKMCCCRHFRSRPDVAFFAFSIPTALAQFPIQWSLRQKNRPTNDRPKGREDRAEFESLTCLICTVGPLPARSAL